MVNLIAEVFPSMVAFFLLALTSAALLIPPERGCSTFILLDQGLFDSSWEPFDSQKIPENAPPENSNLIGGIMEDVI